MYAIAKHNCFNSGIAEVGDIIKVEKLNEYLLKIEGKPPKCGIETRGATPALVAAHDLPFPKCKPETSCNDFTVLYRSYEKLSVVSFWSIIVSRGKTATVKVLSIEAAAKLYDDLSQKLSDRNYLFNEVAYKRSVKQNDQVNADFQKSEKERMKAAEIAKMGPHERFTKGIS